MSVPLVSLGEDVEIPQLGFGVFKVPPDDTAGVVGKAFEVGYRQVDTAAAYGNEQGVGEAVRSSGLPRDEVFVTTKCWNSDHGRGQAKQALAQSLERLEMDHVDLYLIHWPVPARDQYLETWEAFIELRDEGLTRAVGVSNFQPDHLDRIIGETDVTPAVNQIELHPRLQQAELLRKHDELGVVTEAWSPLARGQLLDDRTIRDIADDLGRTPGQIVLRWHLQLGNVVIPKSVTPERIEENFDLFGFELADDQMDVIAGLEAGGRTGPDPDFFDLA